LKLKAWPACTVLGPVLKASKHSCKIQHAKAGDECHGLERQVLNSAEGTIWKTHNTRDSNKIPTTAAAAAAMAEHKLTAVLFQCCQSHRHFLLSCSPHRYRSPCRVQHLLCHCQSGFCCQQS
jgi:hypothetical protein